MRASLLRLAKEKQTYTNISYLLLSFPLGLCYVILLITGLTLGVATLIVWIGVPILLLVLLVWWKLAAFERKMAMQWLNVVIPPMSLGIERDKTRWERLRIHLSNSVTWKSLLYLFLKFLFGTIAFVVTLYILIFMLTLGIITLIVGMFVAPFIYLGTTLMKTSVRSNTVAIQTTKQQVAANTVTVSQILITSVTCGGLLFLPLYVFNGMAWAWGQIARVMLGMSDKDLRLAEARALAEQERAKAEKADQKRRDLIVNVSHELRTPVASIRGHLEALLNTYDEGSGQAPTPASMYKYLTIVHRESMRLGSLVDDLLALARTDTNELRLQLNEVAADQVVEEVYQTLEPLARRDR